MNKLRLDTNTNLLVLVDEHGEEQRYRPLAGSAKDLYDLLKQMAETNPDQVIGTLEGSAHMVQTEGAPASVTSTVSGNIPRVVSRSSNPDSARDAKVTNQPKKVDRSKGGVFKEEDAANPMAMAPVAPPAPAQDYATWEASLGDQVAQINRQKVGDTEVITARDAMGNVISTFTGTEQAGIAMNPVEAVKPLSSDEIDRMAQEVIDSLTK